MARRAKKSKATVRGRPAPRAAAASTDAADAAELQRLIQAVIAAKEAGDSAARDAATEALIDFTTRPVSQELRNAADEARFAADNAVMSESLAALQQYPWPGNIRELRNVVERAMIVVTSSQLTIPLPQSSVSATKRSSRLADVEKEHIRAVVESTGWCIRGSGGAADQLGLRPTTLETRMAKLGLKRPSPA